MNICYRFTLKSLKQNRTRTVVTIIGIILSVAMFTAVTTTASSIQQFMLDVVIQNNGSWHDMIKDISHEQAKGIREQKEVENSAELHNICYAKLENCRNEMKPYLYVAGYDGNFEELMSLYAIEGRLPQNSNEIVLPSDLSSNGGVQYKVGDIIQLPAGTRQNGAGQLLWQSDIYMSEEGEETFVEYGKTEYCVVGIYESAAIGNGMEAGYAALTKAETAMPDLGTCLYVTIENPREAGEFLNRIDVEPMKELKAEPQKETNGEYLRYSGNVTGGVLRMLSGLILILFGIIMFGSIALIGNSFSISVNERKKQYGLLSSIGATRRQLKKSVLYEAATLSVIGIPLGVLAGVGGMSITLYFVSGLLEKFINGTTRNGMQVIRLQMSATLWSILLAAVIGFITVLISAYLPSRKALKVSAIEAIRQSQDIRIRPRQVRTSRLIHKLFGIEGTLASKNFKRNRKKYRATVFSLFISVVLFISASSFCDYMSTSLEMVVQTYSCDLQYIETYADESKDLYQQLKQVKGVTKAAYHLVPDMETLPSAIVSSDTLGEAYQKNQRSAPEDEEGKTQSSESQMVNNVSILFVEDEVYRQYLEEQQLDPLLYINGRDSLALVYDNIASYDEDGRYITYPVFDNLPSEITLCYEKELEKGYQNDWLCRVGKDGELEYRVSQYEESEGTIYTDGSVETSESSVEGSEKWLSTDELYDTRVSYMGARVESPIYGTDYLVGNGLMLYYPESAKEALCPERIKTSLVMCFDGKNPSVIYNEMCNMLEENGRSTEALYNLDEEVQSARALMLVLRIFSYGFVLLISLIAMANVFNTISTNVLLRRREFAMLRSVGMTSKGLRRMMNIECILYGCKGLFFGLLAATGVTYLIYRAMSEELVIRFYIPWYSVVIAIVSVFTVVFATMLYAMAKIRKENVVEILKQEEF